MENIVFPIFGEERFEDMYDVDALDNEDLQAMAQRTGIKSAILYGLVQIGTTEIYIYDVTVSDRVIMRRNRVGIQQLIRKIMETYTSAFIIFHYEDSESWDWRFSFCQKDDKEVTEAKRYTFLLGPDQSCRTAAENFQKLINKHGEISRDDIVQAFDVAALSDEFFGKYKAQYEKFCNYIYDNCEDESLFGYEFAEWDEKLIRDYVKKLLGRIVFLHFLQKKGWLGVPLDGEWGDGDKQFMKHLFEASSQKQKDNYLDCVLEPLFAEALNTLRTDDIFDLKVKGFRNIRIPYLNGGLFERDMLDEPKSTFPASYFDDLFEFFYQYNFTIDENDPNDAEVGIDPEMLGRIFENLLEDNKDKGAFYTPKEIVQYMCRESLIAYLQTDVKKDSACNTIRQFVSSYDASLLPEELKEVLDKKLKDVKICDPAIGSGAFPMGLLRELYNCRKAIEGIDDEKAVNIKTHIIQNNIYGVDIEKGAVDIARLRFWLALIVDEQAPHALPNLDFKIMQGNSLLEQFEGVDLSGMSLNEQEQKRTRKGKAWQAYFAFDEQDALANIQHAIKEYYNSDNHAQKVVLRNVINENVRNYILTLKGCTPDIRQKIKELPIPNDKFFLWHIYFKEVFDKGGFDIVIGNPPYINVQLMSEEDKTLYKKLFSSFFKRCDIFALFIENGLSLSSSDGILTYIIPSVIHSNLSYQKIRDMILNKHWLAEVCYTGGKVFNAPTVDTTIIRCNKHGNDKIILKDAVNFSCHKIYEVDKD